MTEPARYRALGRIVLPATGADASRTIEADENFFYDGVPHAGMMPVNAAARRAKFRALDRHWRQNPHPQQINRLARSLGHTGADGEAARAFIEAFETKEETP